MEKAKEFTSSRENGIGVKSLSVPKRMEEAYRVISSKENVRRVQSWSVPKRMEKAYRVHKFQREESISSKENR
jgi:hypothetical protein